MNHAMIYALYNECGYPGFNGMDEGGGREHNFV